MNEDKDQYNECVICDKKEYTTGEPIRHYVCDDCYDRERIEAGREQEEAEHESYYNSLEGD